MKDPAVRAFLKYARLGLDRRDLTSAELALRLRGSFSEVGVAELMTVYDTLRVLEAVGKGESAEAVRAVYFRGRGRTPRKNDISYAVLRFARERSMDERTVWRRLYEARRLYTVLLKGQMEKI